MEPAAAASSAAAAATAASAAASSFCFFLSSRSSCCRHLRQSRPFPFARLAAAAAVMAAMFEFGMI
jgi:hypothetical protein